MEFLHFMACAVAIIITAACEKPVLDDSDIGRGNTRLTFVPTTHDISETIYNGMSGSFPFLIIT